LAYYVVRVQTPDSQSHVLVFVLDSGESLMDQVEEKVGADFKVLSVNLLGVDWPI